MTVTTDTYGSISADTFVRVCASHVLPSRVRRVNQHAGVEGGRCAYCEYEAYRTIYFTRGTVGDWRRPTQEEGR